MMKQSLLHNCQSALIMRENSLKIVRSPKASLPGWWTQQYQPSYISNRILVRNFSSNETEDKTPFYKRIFRSQKTQDQVNYEKEIDQKIKDEENILRSIAIEEREARIKRKQNRSKLHYSHRNILKGEPPQVGLHMEWDETHMTRAYKAQLLGQFGSTKTGIDPSICWPTREEMADELEKERVFYDNKTLLELMEEDKRQKKEKSQAIIDREKEMDEKLARMDVDLKAWKSRVETRKRFAQREIDKRTQILKELRQEFGYDVNANDPQFAEKLAAKEKEYSKKAKEEKKREKEEKIKAYKESFSNDAKQEITAVKKEETDAKEEESDVKKEETAEKKEITGVTKFSTKGRRVK